MEVTSNISELEKHLKTVFQGMFQSQEMQDAGKKVYDTMYTNVRARMESTGYDYKQSGDFLRAFDDEKKGFSKDNNTKNSMTVGFGDITGGGGLNDPNYMRQEQTAMFTNGITMMANGSLQPNISMVTLKAETQMPKWIVLEFGTGPQAQELPPQFAIGYTRKSDSNLMYGPSYNTPSGLNKRVFAMLNAEQVAKLRGEDKESLSYNRTHPGTRPGMFFQNGLKDSKDQIYREFGKGIESYLKSMGG